MKIKVLESIIDHPELNNIHLDFDKLQDEVDKFFSTYNKNSISPVIFATTIDAIKNGEINKGIWWDEKIPLEDYQDELKEFGESNIILLATANCPKTVEYIGDVPQLIEAWEKISKEYSTHGNGEKYSQWDNFIEYCEYYEELPTKNEVSIFIEKFYGRYDSLEEFAIEYVEDYYPEVGKLDSIISDNLDYEGIAKSLTDNKEFTYIKTKNDDYIVL